MMFNSTPYVTTSVAPSIGSTMANPGAARRTGHAPGGVITDVNSVTTADLDSAAFNTPIETLADLWVTRYGDEWVDVDRLLEDSFFGAAYKRLKSLGRLETHYLTDRARFVCRKPT
jgi:hypothetical protein